MRQQEGVDRAMQGKRFTGHHPPLNDDYIDEKEVEDEQ